MKLLGSVLGLVIAVTLLLLWLMGAFTPKVEPGPPALVLSQLGGAPVHVVQVAQELVLESATGTVEPVHETTVGSRLLARVVALDVTAGERVAAGDVLVRLDDEALQAALEEARAVERQAEVEREQAQNDLARAARLADQGLISVEEHEKAQTRRNAAVAAVERANQSVRAAASRLDDAVVKAPMTGTVVDKLVDVGDMVAPGQPLVALYDPGRMQLVAEVREALGARLEPGEMVRVDIDALDLECEGEIAEIVPRAAATSRTFEVKVTGPCPPGVRAGMFGRISVEVGERETIRVPEGAILAVGQLDMVVAVLPDDRLLRRFVQLGSRDGGMVEVRSGLTTGDRILADASVLEHLGGER